MRSVLVIVGGVALLVGCGVDRPADPVTVTSNPVTVTSTDARIDDAIRRGVAFLAAHQDDDGRLGPSSYAALRDGHALTALGLAAWPSAPEHHSAYTRGLEFIAGIVLPDGTITKHAYPYYAIPLTLLVLQRSGDVAFDAQIDALVKALRQRQFGVGRGTSKDDPSYGGWGYDLEPPSANLSATMLAIEALRSSGVPPEDPALVDARGFVERCQNFEGTGDGGFFFAPVLADANKAGTRTDGTFRSYGSMTADGQRALLALGQRPSDPRVLAATTWLRTHFDATQNPGDFPAVAEVRRASSYYYWAWTSAHALRFIGDDRGRPEALAQALLERQRDDGSWSNAASEMREDDPLVATPMAMAALGLCRDRLAAIP